MRPSALLACSLLVGLLVGGGMHWLSQEVEPSAVLDPEFSEERQAASRDQAPAPTLQGDRNAPRGLAAVEQRILRNPSRRQLGALALLYAAEGREDDLVRMLHAALEAGIDPDRVLDAIRELPKARQGAALAEILARHPDAAFDAARAARIFVDSGDPARALSVVRDALPIQRRFAPELTKALFQLDPAGAADFLFALEGSAKWDADDIQSLVGLLSEAGQANGALAFIERALEASPEDADMLRVLARIDPNAAIDRLRSLVSDNPNDVTSWSRLARLLRKEGDKGGAFDALSKALARKPSRSLFDELLRIDPQRALPMIKAWSANSADDEAIGLLARAYMKAGNDREAADEFFRAHQSDPDDSEWIRGLIRLDPERAVKSLEEQLARAPGAADEDVLGHYADALRSAGRSAEAFDQYLAAHRKDPGDKDWQAAMARMDPERALPVLSAFLEADPNDASGRGAYGVALASMGRKAEAADALERALARGNAKTWYAELAKLDPERAVKALSRRARKERNDELWGALGKALRDQGRAQEARAAFRRALALDPTDADWADALRD